MRIFKMVFVLFLAVIIFSILFLRIVPNYSKKFGFEIVSLSDYKRYQDGYCLKENRILPKNEIYKRAVIEYLKYKIELDKKIEDYRVRNYGSSWKSEVELGYYELRDDINLDNWLTEISNDYKIIFEATKNGEISREEAIDIFFNEKLEIKKTDGFEFVIFDFDKGVAGFQKPILQVGYGTGCANILLDNFILMDDSKLIGGYTFFFIYSFLDYEYSNKLFLEKDRQIKEFKKSKIKDSYYGNLGNIDNCGNLDFELEKRYMEMREAKGG